MKENNNNIPIGYKQTKLGIIPEEWEVHKLGDILTIKHGKNQTKVIDKNGKYPILGTGGLMGYANSYLWNKPSVLIGRKGTINKPQYMDTPFWTVDTLFYTDINENILPKWLFYKFWTINWKKYNEASGVPSLSASTISSIPIILPPLPEQKAIAKILSTWDKAINNYQLLIDKYKLKKKALMQQLLKPKDDWKVVRLGDLGAIITGNTPPTKNKNNYGVDFLFVSPVDIGKIKYIKETAKGLSSVGFDVSRKLPKGSICFVCIGSTIGKIAIASTQLATNQQINSIVVNRRNNNEFIYYSLSYYSQKIRLIAGEQAVPMINKTDFSQVRIPICPNKETQTKIANILSSADKEISILEQQLAKLKEQKKGLMQVLLTGKKRVKLENN